MEATDLIRVNSGSTVKDIAEYLGVAVPEVIKKLMSLGEMATLTQTLSDDAIQVLADEFDKQIEILQQELASEEANLAKAKEDLAEQEGVRTGDERNYARVLERLQPYKDRVETHEKNVEALKRELANQNR